jgi:hypothetical protein
MGLATLLVGLFIGVALSTLSVSHIFYLQFSSKRAFYCVPPACLLAERNWDKMHVNTESETTGRKRKILLAEPANLFIQWGRMAKADHNNFKPT